MNQGFTVTTTIRSSWLQRVALLPKVVVFDAPTTTASLFGVAKISLVLVGNTAATAIPYLGIASFSQIRIANTPAASASLPGVAVGTLVTILNAAATSISGFSVTSGTQVAIFDAPTAAITGLGVAVLTLIAVTNAAAVCMGVSAEQEQHCKDESHFVLLF